MKHIRAVSFLSIGVLLLVACGGGVDEGFTGQWRGNTTVVGGGTSFSYAATINLVADGDALRVSQICPDGSGSIHVPGEGTNLRWGGEFNCPIALASCSTARVVYTTANIVLGASGVVISANGTLSGCGSSLAISSTFTGSK